MRWCILPAHTHSQIRLDLHELNAKSADPRVPERAHGRGKIGILAKEQIQCTTATETNANRTPSQDERRATRVPMTHRSKQSCPGSRACNPARSNIFQYTSTKRAHTHVYKIQFYTTLYTKAHLSTL